MSWGIFPRGWQRCIFYSSNLFSDGTVVDASFLVFWDFNKTNWKLVKRCLACGSMEIQDFHCLKVQSCSLVCGLRISALCNFRFSYEHLRSVHTSDLPQSVVSIVIPFAIVGIEVVFCPWINHLFNHRHNINLLCPSPASLFFNHPYTILGKKLSYHIRCLNIFPFFLSFVFYNHLFSFTLQVKIMTKIKLWNYRWKWNRI